MSMLTLEKILAAKDGAGDVETMEVPEWGGDIGLKKMTSGERDAYELSNLDLEGDQPEQRRENFRARLVAHCLCNTKGVLVCANKKGEITDDKVKSLATKGAKVLGRVWERAAEINGLNEAATKDIESDLSDAQPDASSSN